MDIADIATREYVEVDADERLSKVRSIFEHENPRGVIVTNDEGYAGVITQQQLLQSHVEDDAKAGAMVKAAPKVERTANVRDVARMLVEGDTKLAPVFEAGELWGIVTADAILDAVIDNLDVLTVEQIHTDNIVTVTEDTHIGRAINLLRENGISRLPVINDDGRLSGMVTTSDIVDVAVRNMSKATEGDRAGDIDRVLDLPVYDEMSSPVVTIDLEDTVEEAVETMFEYGYSGLVVTPEYDDSMPAGILTKTDILRALSYTEEEHMDVQITNIDLLDTITRDDIRQSIEQVVQKYQQMSVQHAHVRFQKHREKLRGTPLIQCQIRLRTNRGQVAGSGEGYGAESGFRVALDKLERNVIEMKGMRSDEKYKGQLLRKLDEL